MRAVYATASDGEKFQLVALPNRILHAKDSVSLRQRDEMDGQNSRGRRNDIAGIGSPGNQFFFSVPRRREGNIVQWSRRGAVALIWWSLVRWKHFFPRRGKFKMYSRLVVAIKVSQRRH